MFQFLMYDEEHRKKYAVNMYWFIIYYYASVGEFNYTNVKLKKHLFNFKEVLIKIINIFQELYTVISKQKLNFVQF